MTSRRSGATPRTALQFALLMLVALAASGQARAAEDVAVRAADHGGYGRIAFGWPAAVSYEAKLAKDTLTIHFGRPLRADLKPVTSGLASYVASIALSDDDTTVIAHLKRPVAIRPFVVLGKTIAIDLTPAAGDAAPKPAAAKPAAKTETPPAPKAVPAPGAVGLRVSERRGQRRVAFDWPHRVEFSLADKDGEAQLVFRAKGTIDAARLKDALPELLPRLDEAEGATTLAMKVPAGLHLKALRAGRSILLEVSGKPQPAAQPAADAASAPAPPPAAAAAAAPPQALMPASGAAPAAAAPTDADASPPPAPSPPASVAVRFTTETAAVSLRFDWPMPTAAAVYRRGMGVWVVFAVPSTLELADARAKGQRALRIIEQLPSRDATVLRLVPADGLAPSVRRNGTAWILDLKPQPARTDAPIPVEAQPSATPASVFLRVHGAAPPVMLRDPELGDRLIVVPVDEIGRGIGAPQDFVDFRLLETLQGAVLRANADDIAVHVDKDGAEITRPGGLFLSSERDRLLGQVLASNHRLFDFAAWGGSGQEGYIARRDALERAIATAPQGARSKPRLELAHFYFAQLFGAETLAVLEAIGRDDPELAGEPATHALKGAACFLAEQNKCAADELGLASLDGEPEAALWRAALAARSGDWETAARGFLASVSLLPTYPKALRDRFALAAAEAMLEMDRAPSSAPLIDLVLQDLPESADQAMALYLRGRLAQQTGHLDRALQDWDQVAKLGDTAAAARARFARALALFDAGRASRSDTIKALDALRFVWRGDSQEFTLLRRLGELKLAEGDQSGGFEAMLQAVKYFPGRPAAKEVTKEASDAFAQLFLGPGAADVPPLKALALYDQFHDLEPVGDRRDAILRKLIDRLVSVDLLDRAASLLQEQVANRLTGADKARGATQLALLQLMDYKPDAALKALDIDIGNDVPPELGLQRQQLRARALMELGKPKDALAIIASDTSRDADRLRADIYWRSGNWQEAAKVLARLAGAPPTDGKLDAETGRLVVSLAAALTLAGDEAAVQKLRDDYGQAMAGTAFADSFRLLVDNGPADLNGDPSAVARRVAQLGELQSFMAAYKQRLATTKLSSAVN